jgi:alkyldihydroxyacetonephosphate synthase
MRRWNGWGDDQYHYHLPAPAHDFLVHLLGPGSMEPDATFESALAAVPPSRLPADPAYSTAAGDRLLHARGQSLPDWIALRSGRIGCFPDGVACPTQEADIPGLLQMAARQKINLIPYGGGTSVAGHINPLPSERPVLSVDLRRLNRLISLDRENHLAVIQAGAAGSEIEAQLKQHGYTLGHYPQSFEYSTLGGWIATRSCGQQSAYYGRIEDLFAGGSLETFNGPMMLPPIPASAAGPDLRQFILGSEGRLGFITRANVRVRPLPETEDFYGLLFHDWEAGLAALHLIAQEKSGISMLRLSDAQETQVTLLLSGQDRLLPWAKRGLGLIGYTKSPCLLVYAVTGSASLAGSAHRRIRSQARRQEGFYTGTLVGRLWRKSRFSSPYLRNTLWEQGFALDTLETALNWSQLLPAAAAIKRSLTSALESMNTPVLVFAHVSSVYPSGASLYLTYIFPRSADPDQMLTRWQAAKHAASQAILEHGGTISHQHGVGLDHAPYLGAEKSPSGIALLQSVLDAFDPYGLLNPGKLLVGRGLGSQAGPPVEG